MSAQPDLTNPALQGWQYNADISLHIIGDDGDTILAFGHVDKAEFLTGARILWRDMFSEDLDGGKFDDPLEPDDVQHAMVALLRQHNCPTCQCDEWSLSRAADVDKSVPVTMLTEVGS